MATGGKILDIAMKNKKLIIGIVIIILVIVLWQRHAWKLGRLFNPSQRNNSPEATINDARKEGIEKIANRIYEDIESTPIFGHDYTPYEEALNLYDNEIEYLATYYKTHLNSGSTLWDSIDSQWYTWGYSPLKLQSKLKELKTI